MAEAKKARAKSTRGTTRPTPAQDAAVSAPLDAPTDVTLFSQPIVPPNPQPDNLEKLPPLAQQRSEALRQAVREAVTVSARGALEVNDKIIEALQAQSDAAIELWRTTLSTPRLAEAIRVQADGTRQAYETASARWTDIATTTAQWFNRSLEPLQSAFHRPGR